MHEQTRNIGGFLRLIASLILLGGAIWFFVNRQQILDQFTVWQYKPSAAIQALANDSYMAPDGQFYFYASQPEINDRASFNKNCSSTGEQTVVLGCYSARRIFIFDINDPRLEGVEEVTAAHEMLHAVYDRLSTKDKHHVNELLETQLKTVTDERIRNLIAVYERTEPGQRLNEIHSIFATELTSLTPELEAYYGKYFTDRTAIAKLSQQYEQVFATIKQQQAALIDELNALGDKIESDTETYNSETDRLNQDIAAFNAKARNGGYSSQSQFDAERNSLLLRQTRLTQLRAAISSDISLYESKRKELESLNGQAEQLNRSIDSKALEPAPSI